MAATGVAVHLYWNGRMKTKKYDVIYEGDNMNVMPIKLNYGTTYAELLDKIYATTGVDRKDFEMNIICRYPISTREYKPIPIKNDEAVDLMLEVPCRSSRVYCVEIFLEKEPMQYVKPFGCSLLVTGVREGRKWEELKMDCLVNVFRKVGMESLLLDVPFVCKAWYKASLDPQCWEHLIFPEFIKPDDIWDSSPLGERLMMDYQESFSVTAFIKSVVARSQRGATILRLPICCTEEALEYVANESPSLKALSLHARLLWKQSTVIPKLIRKWKNLEMLVLRSRHNMEEILAQISLHCNNFIKLFAPGIYVGKDEATAMVTSLPNLKYLVLKGSTIERENLVMVLQGCKELRHLDVRQCIGFDEDDAQILELASHIPTFMCKGSILCDYYGESVSSKDAAIDCDYCSD